MPMTTNRNHHPDHHPDHQHDKPDDDRPQADPLRPDRIQCACGATAERDGLCRKCRARALWGRRDTGRRARATRPTPTRPRTRRPGR
jgi:hypothetical protein